MERNANADYDLLAATVELYNDVSNDSGIIWWEEPEDEDEECSDD